MITYELKNHIGILKLNRPEKRNALHPDLVYQMKEKLLQIRDDDDAKALIITGEGKAFCAGADLSYLNKLRNNSTIENEKDTEELAEFFLNIYRFPKPTIAAVNGAAIAGGCGLASVCDLVVADETHSKFGYSEVKIGFLPAIVSIFIIKRVGEGLARQLLITGDIINSKRAYEIGFVNYIYYNALDGAIDVSSNIIKNYSDSLRDTKAMIDAVSNLNVEDAINYCIRLNTISRSTDDFQKGLNSFLNK
ncbi:MAG: enoyl-CoA hydratase/isomerase family protein [Ignavibacteriaceae bacterium]